MSTTLAVLDMAGTTIDDRDVVYRVLREAVRREDVDVTDAQFQQWMGAEKRFAIGRLLELGGLTPEQSRVDEAFEWFRGELHEIYTAHPPTPLAGVENALEALRSQGVKIALTTGFSRDVAELILAAMGWGIGADRDSTVADVLVCSDEVPNGRPAPDLILEAMRRAGVEDFDDVVAAGDTAVDITAAQNAGVTSIGVLTGHLGSDAFQSVGADVVLESTAELPEYLLGAASESAAGVPVSQA
jgi:phosphoglycolate phosphatase